MITATVTYKCDFCDKKIEEKYIMTDGSFNFRQNLIEDWVFQENTNNLICDEHIVTQTVEPKIKEDSK